MIESYNIPLVFLSIGMLAFKLPVAISYDITLTFASLLSAILVAVIVLWFMGRNDSIWSVLFCLLARLLWQDNRA